MEIVFNHKLSKLDIVADIGKHRNVESVGKVDEVFHTDEFFLIPMNNLGRNRFEDIAFLIGQRVKPLGKEVQLVDGRAVDPDLCEFGQAWTIEDGDVMIGVIIACDPCFLIGIPNLMFLGRQFHVTVKPSNTLGVLLCEFYLDCFCHEIHLLTSSF